MIILTWVKICGITREEDARAVAAAGADAIGVVVGAPSPRAVNKARARDILKTGRDLDGVMVVTSENVEELVGMAKAVSPKAIQLHGKQGPSLLADLTKRLEFEGLAGIRLLKSIGIGSDAQREDLLQRCRSYERFANGLLLDTEVMGAHGGTGTLHDWNLSRWLRDQLKGIDIVLAGGLDPGNVAKAISAVRPFGVDVSSGVEISPGIKNPNLVMEFVAAVRDVG